MFGRQFCRFVRDEKLFFEVDNKQRGIFGANLGGNRLSLRREEIFSKNDNKYIEIFV